MKKRSVAIYMAEVLTYIRIDINMMSSGTTAIELCVFKKNTIPSLQEGNIQAINAKAKSDMLNTFFSLCWNNSEPPLFEADNTTYSENAHNHSLSLDDLL